MKRRKKLELKVVQRWNETDEWLEKVACEVGRDTESLAFNIFKEDQKLRKRRKSELTDSLFRQRQKDEPIGSGPVSLHRAFVYFDFAIFNQENSTGKNEFLHTELNEPVLDLIERFPGQTYFD